MLVRLISAGQVMPPQDLPLPFLPRPSVLSTGDVQLRGASWMPEDGVLSHRDIGRYGHEERGATYTV